MIRRFDQVDYLGGIYALQSQLGKTIHPAGKTALSMQGKSHYLELQSGFSSSVVRTKIYRSGSKNGTGKSV